MWKKQLEWVQPPTQRGEGKSPVLNYEALLDIVREVPVAEIESWNDIDRLDVRPSKGIVKVRSENRWEIQVDNQTGEVLLVAFRRSDWIESIHDGSFFHDQAKLWIFFPSAATLLVLWVTGLILFFYPLPGKIRKGLRGRRRKRAALQSSSR